MSYVWYGSVVIRGNTIYVGVDCGPNTIYMTDTIMPAAEVTKVASDEKKSYEFAFHILPTVAEGEVAHVFEEIKAHIAKEGVIFDEEMPERIDLVYPIVKSLEGKNRKFTSAYFGWIRFTLEGEGEKINLLVEELTHISSILRHLTIKLTALEEAHPYRFHEHHKSAKMVTTFNEDDGEEVVVESEGEVDVVDTEDAVIETSSVEEKASEV